MIDAALSYADLGWHVFPCAWIEAGACSCGKPDCASPGKHPLVSWQQEATNDPEQVTAWWERWPLAHVGIATGARSGLVVIDLDVRDSKNGIASLESLAAPHGGFPQTGSARTGSGGRHLFLNRPGGHIPNSAGQLGKGIDVRGDGGYVIAPPSGHISGGCYQWENDLPLADVPAWLRPLLNVRESAAKPGAPAVAFPPADAETLTRARADLARFGPAVDGQGGGLKAVQAAAILTHDYALTDEEAWPLLCEWNETCVPPYDTEDDSAGEDSLRERLRRGRKYGSTEYGSKRTLDAFGEARRLIAEYEAGGRGEPAMLVLLDRIRDLEFSDPARRKLIEMQLSGMSGLGSNAVALPKAIRRATRSDSEDGYNFDCSTTGVPHSNLANAVKVFEHEKAQVWWDTFLQRISTSDGPWTEEQDRTWAVHMQSDLGLSRVTTTTIAEAVRTYAERNPRNTVKDALEALTWDGTPRLEQFIPMAFGAENSDYTRAAGRNFLRTLVARPLQPGCKVDTMLVLEGQQGAKKSTACRVLVGGALFAESSESPHSKDFFLALHGKWLVEIAELDSFSRADVSAVKRVLTCQSDRYRAPYARDAKDWPRQGIFVGTTNRDDWAVDDTGNRRFWPVRCTRVDLDYIRENRAQLFAEAVATLEQGWWDMPGQETEAEQEARRQVDPWEEILSRTLKDVDACSSGEALDFVEVHPSQRTKREQVRVSIVLRRLGFTRTGRTGRGAAVRWERVA